MVLFCAILYYLCSVLWLLQFFDERDPFKLVISAIWLAGGIIQTIRHIKSKKETKEE